MTAPPPRPMSHVAQAELDGVALIADGAYLEAAHGVIAAAREYCLASVFIVETSPWRDERMAVDGLLVALAEATWRGVDTRLLVGGSRTNRDIAELAVAAAARAAELGVAARVVAGASSRGSHAKVIAADGRLLLGSHNWSPGAFGGEVQDSLLIASRAAAEVVRARLDATWRYLGGEA